MRKEQRKAQYCHLRGVLTLRLVWLTSESLVQAWATYEAQRSILNPTLTTLNGVHEPILNVGITHNYIQFATYQQRTKISLAL